MNKNAVIDNIGGTLAEAEKFGSIMRVNGGVLCRNCTYDATGVTTPPQIGRMYFGDLRKQPVGYMVLRCHLVMDGVIYSTMADAVDAAHAALDAEDGTTSVRA
jgi:hypothetical protein